jgi:hypothetical protein
MHSDFLSRAAGFNHRLTQKNPLKRVRHSRQKEDQRARPFSQRNQRSERLGSSGYDFA